jgi:hypothetical protein
MSRPLPHWGATARKKRAGEPGIWAVMKVNRPLQSAVEEPIGAQAGLERLEVACIW